MSATAMWSKTLLYNPFLYLAGFKSLVMGTVSILLLAFFSYTSGTHYLGLVIPMFAKDETFPYFLSEHLVHWTIVSVLLFISGMIFSKSRIRFIDVLGTQALALFPLIILPFFRLLPPFESFYLFSVNYFFLYGLHVVMAIWTVTLMFNAYKITCNVKHNSLVISFITSVFISEVLTIYLIYFIKNNLNL